MPRKKFPNLSVGRGEKLPVSQGAGLTEKGRRKARAAGSNLKAPTKDPKNPSHDTRHSTIQRATQRVILKRVDE